MKITKVLFDTNIILDVLLDRKPFVADSIQLFSRVEAGKLQGIIAATTVTTIFYLSTKVLGTINAKQAIQQLLSLYPMGFKLWVGAR